MCTSMTECYPLTIAYNKYQNAMKRLICHTQCKQVSASAVMGGLCAFRRDKGGW